MNEYDPTAVALTNLMDERAQSDPDFAKRYRHGRCTVEEIVQTIAPRVSVLPDSQRRMAASGLEMDEKSIELALREGKVTAHVSEQAQRMVLVLRPGDGSSVFQLVATIEEVKEL